MMNKLAQLITEYKQLGIDQQIDYDKLYLYSIITHSTAIEGSTITEIENRLLFDDGISANKPIYEQLMNLDLKAAYTKAFQMADNHDLIDDKKLRELSALVMKNTGSEYNTAIGSFNSANGDFRLLNVSAGFNGRSYLSWQKISAKINEFCQWLNLERSKISENQIEKIYELSFQAHYHLVTIHPWADGNGRMARIVMNIIQKEFNMIPSIVKKENKAQYIQSLSDAQENDDIKIFLDFMTDEHIKNITHRIKEYQKSIQ